MNRARWFSGTGAIACINHLANSNTWIGMKVRDERLALRRNRAVCIECDNHGLKAKRQTFPNHKGGK
jgi:hypothetical protein